MRTDCPFEPNVIDAVANDAWTASLRAHVTSCEDCAAAADVAPWMNSFAGINEREHILPDPAVLWLKARLLQSNAAVERASLPITRLQIAAYLIIAACWAALLTWKSAALQLWINHLSPSHIILNASANATASLSVTVLFAVLALASATVGVAMHTILAEE
ncbi:MAG TPA: hypothetical protein VGQ46_21835 [Thermoanaerobaculia bacterium]|jgi:hypothetical protein|nr:hypothetical protein [Thermoanaerobaculia bacterium]